MGASGRKGSRGGRNKKNSGSWTSWLLGARAAQSEVGKEMRLGVGLGRSKEPT